MSDTYYRNDTPQKVRDILENARISNTRVKLYYGDTKNGKDWMEEHHTTGRIGRSTGRVKIPILLSNSRSRGGVAISDNSIVRIKVNGQEVYRHPQYHQKKIEIVRDEKNGYEYSINLDGVIYSRHKTYKSAQLLAGKLS